MEHDNPYSISSLTIQMFFQIENANGHSLNVYSYDNLVI